jgi:hypothetical protein
LSGVIFHFSINFMKGEHYLGIRILKVGWVLPSMYIYKRVFVKILAGQCGDNNSIPSSGMELLAKVL